MVAELFSREIGSTLDDQSDYLGDALDNTEVGGSILGDDTTANLMRLRKYWTQRRVHRLTNNTIVEERRCKWNGLASRGEKLIARQVQTYNEDNVEFAFRSSIQLKSRRQRIALLVFVRADAKESCVNIVASWSGRIVKLILLQVMKVQVAQALDIHLIRFNK